MSDWINITDKMPVDKYNGASERVLVATKTQYQPIVRNVLIAWYDYDRQEWRDPFGALAIIWQK